MKEEPTRPASTSITLNEPPAMEPRTPPHQATPSAGFVTPSPIQSAQAVTRSRQQLTPRHLHYGDEDATVNAARAVSATQSNAATSVVPVTPPRPSYCYAVAKGRRVGVYKTHAEMLEETRDYDNSVFRVCITPEEAERFIDRYFDVTLGRRSDPDPRHPSTLVAFCDGATEGNRNWCHHAGVCCLFPHNSAWDILYTSDDMYCTVYRATAKAAVAAIERANKENPTQDQVLYIYTRNQLLVRAMTEWIDKWLANDWKKGDGLPVKNQDVLRRLITAQGQRRILWRLEDHWSSEWTASAVSAAEDAALLLWSPTT